ncbi:unnamed protein product [Brassicogethes aeneus]|uniref:ATPase AAA-type core domain-containing protein n=1 Tax=Brassicogethes aeneus TaxID=1431903 RepID=A0A9P0AR00_BRAAE|nr:unnamed protein product [Brassicogethes aeneus]
MSHITYDEKFKETQELLTSTLQLEPVQADRREQRSLLANLYVRYIMIANKLNVCVDQMVQPQKCMLIRKLLEATIGRILELKEDLVEADINEYTHVGDVIDSLNITPLDTELKVPTCFRKENADDLTYKKNLIESILSRFGYLDKVEEKVPMTEQQAILIIQTHERARQGRLRAQFMKEIRSIKEKGKPAQEEADSEEKQAGIGLNAALKIQKIWRGYVTRRATRRRRLQEMLLIGMIPPPKTKSAGIEKDLKNQGVRTLLKEQRKIEYKEDVKKIREDLEKNQRGAVLEQLSDQVRGWLHEYKSQTGKIPEYTGSERTGSRNLMSRQGTDSELSKSTQLSKDSKSKKDKGGKSKDKADEEEELCSRAIVSTFVPELNLRKEEYDDTWKIKDEKENLRQFSYKDIIEHEQMTEMENELRKVISTIYNKDKDPPIDLGDLRQIVNEYCILPLLTPQLHQSTPHIKSVLLAGPKGSGKDMLVHAICNEAGAMLFDLTPSNIVGKYPGKSGLIMLIHLVVKVSRLLQPSVIYMDNAERPFVKKIPKTDKSDPKRLKKDLPKIVKNFCQEDRVILIGTTNCPWESDQKLLQQVYQKIIRIPRPNYSSRYFVWKTLLDQYQAVGWQFDTGVMAKISDGYTVGSIMTTVKEVMTVKRTLQLRIHPLSPLELVNSLCQRTPVYKEEEEASELWWNKVPIVKRRNRTVEMLLVEEAELLAKQANAKKK